MWHSSQALKESGQRRPRLTWSYIKQILYVCVPRYIFTYIIILDGFNSTGLTGSHRLETILLEPHIGPSDLPC